MNMKKKLLITMGCSLTEGAGCYDYSKMSQLVQYYKLPKEENIYQRKRFYELGWPNRVGKKLGFDKVLNIGLGGSSNLVSLNRFLGLIAPQIKLLKQDYEIFVIWMMTDPARFSFSGKGRFVNFHPSGIDSKHSLPQAYIKDSITSNFFPEIDQAYIIRISELIFKSFDLNFIFTSWNDTFINLQENFYSPYFLTPYPYHLWGGFPPELRSKVCKHPNEEGYEKIAVDMFNLLIEFHPNFRVGPDKDTVDWDYIDDIDNDRHIYPYIFL